MNPCFEVYSSWTRKKNEQEEREGVAFNDVARFDHDFVQDDAKTQHKEVSPATMVDGPVKSEHGSTLWNGKMILMSGLSRNALEELSSERDYDDQIPHFFNMLGLVFLKDGNSLIAIGGLWETTDRFRKGVVQAGGFANSRAARFLFPASKGSKQKCHNTFKPGRVNCIERSAAPLPD